MPAQAPSKAAFPVVRYRVSYRPLLAGVDRCLRQISLDNELILYIKLIYFEPRPENARSGDSTTSNQPQGDIMSESGSNTATVGKPVPGGTNVLVEFDNGIAWVTMNRPAKRNAISPALAT